MLDNTNNVKATLFQRLLIAGGPATRRQMRGGWLRLRRLLSILLPLIMFGGAGYFLGYQILTTSEQAAIGTVVGLIVLPILTSRVHIGVIAIMLISATIVYPDAIPRPFTVGGMGFDMSEVMIGAMAVVVFVRHISLRKLEFFRSPITLPVMAFLVSIGFSLFLALVDQPSVASERIDFRMAYNAGPRQMIPYLFFFVVAFGIQTEKQFRMVLRVLIWASVIVAMTIIAQYFVGHRMTLAIGSGTTTWVLGATEGEEDVVRAIPPGLSPILILFLFTSLYASVKGVRGGLVALAAAAVMGMGIVFSFTRNFWIPTFVGVFIASLMSTWAVRRRFLGISVVLGLSVVVLSVAVGQMGPSNAGYKFAKTLNGRFMSIFESKTIKSSSLDNRVRETRNGIRLLKQSPIRGVGIGRPFEYLYVQNRRGDRIIPYYLMHNSYLWIYMTFGLPAFLCIFWMSIAFLLRCFALYRRLGNPEYKALALAFFCGYIGLLIKAVSGGVFQQGFDVCTMTLMWGLVEVMWRLFVDPGTQKQLVNDTGRSVTLAAHGLSGQSAHEVGK